MKKILLIASMLWGVAFAQPCADEDTVRSTAVSLITYNSARINGSISHFAAAYVTIALKYVRWGQTDTVTTTGLSPLRNITGLVSSTLYFYYYQTICASGTNSNTGIRTFTTASQVILYANERPTQFAYLKADTGFMVPRQDTSIFRAPNLAGSIVFKPGDSRFYGYNGAYWQPLAIDSTGIIALLDGKVDSVTTSAGIIYYWKQGVSTGFMTPATFGVSGRDDEATADRAFDLDDFDLTFSNVGTFNINGSFGSMFEVGGKNAGHLRFGDPSSAGDYDGLSILSVNQAGGPGDQFDLTMNTDDGFILHYSNGEITANNVGGNKLQFNSSWFTLSDSIEAHLSGGIFNIDSLNYSANADDSMMVWRKSTGRVGIRAISSGGSQTPWTSNINADGFTLFGNDGSGQDLTLGSTSHATKGKILFGTSAYDEVNNKLYIGQTTGTYDVDVKHTFDGTAGMFVLNESGGGSAAAAFGLYRSLGAQMGVQHYFAGDGNTIFTPLSYNMINDAGSTGGMNLVNLANAPILFGTSNATRITLSGAGAVRFHTYGAGTITSDASGNLTSVSDVRLKNVRGSYKGGLSEIMKITPIVYKWNSASGMETKHDYIGFSAQNIRYALGADATGINSAGQLSIQDRAIMAAMINAIQELKAEIEDLKKQIK